MGAVNDRARVPFALVGVLILVSSAMLTATVGTHTPQQRPALDRAVAGATAEMATVLRSAADDAATAASSSPVTAPANTTAGRALNDSQPFRDALRLRIYLTARTRLDHVSARRGETTVTASLPPVDATTEGYRTAIERVHVESAGADGAALRVELEGVELEATRGGRTIETVERSPSLVVANPALLLHDRTERFQRRANAPVTQAGIGRRVTARLYPLAWARGHAQHRGAPIANVVANRHVELVTNDALLAEQRAVFGRADPAGHRAMAAAGRRVGVTDFLAGAGGEERWTDYVLDGADRLEGDSPKNRPVGTWRDGPPDTEVTVEARASADRAYADLLGVDTPAATGDDAGSDRDLSGVIERAHTVEARVAADRRRQSVSRREEPSPGPRWRLVDERTETSVDLDETEGEIPTASGWSTRSGGVYDAVVTETTTRRWRRGNETRRTESVFEREIRIRLAVQARTVPIADVPQGDIDGALSSAADRATASVIREAGGLPSAARTAAVGATPPTATATAQPTVTRDRAEAELGAVYRQTKNISVTVSGPEIGAGRVNPIDRLRAELSARRPTAKGERDTTARGRTLLAIRAAYLDGLDARLQRRAATQKETNAGIEGAVAEHLDTDRLDGALAAHRLATRPDPKAWSDPAGNLTLAVDTAPAYLTTGEVRRERLAARGGGTVHPLSARNVNVFTSPHGHVAESVLDHIPHLTSDRVALATAAETLSAAEGVSPSRREPLQREVASANTYVSGRLHTAMVDAGVSDREAKAALSVDASSAETARALANGSVVDRAVGRVDADVADERLRVRLETTLDAALTDERARPREDATTAVGEAIRQAARKELKATIETGVEAGTERTRKRALGKRMGALPAGFPVAPVPGYWYVTTNVWYVDVGGTYERFVVRSDRGGPAGGTTYVRDGRTVTLDHGGREIRLGSAERVSFRTETVIVVVVPPTGTGVGDTDGYPDERSSGWPPDESTPNGT